MTTMKRSVMAAFAAVALPFGLAACSDSSDEDPATTSAETSAEQTTDEQTTDEETTSEETTTEEGTTDSGEASGDRPSKEEYRQGMEELLVSMGYTEEKYASAGVTADQIDQYYNCIVDDSYDKLSDGFIQGVANADASAPTEAGDMEVFQASIEMCVQQLGGNQ